MTAKKSQEPLLNTVARKLGHAAGTLTNVAQELTENLSAIPQAVSTKVRQAATTGAREAARAPGSEKKKATRAGVARRNPKAKARLKRKRSVAASKSQRNPRRPIRRKNKA